MDIDQLTDFFEWMTLINVILLLFSTVMIYLFKDVVHRIHGKMFNLSREQVSSIIYGYLAIFKIFVIVFNLTPFLALLLIS